MPEYIIGWKRVKLFVENLTNIDFSFLHSERGLMGESWLVRLELDGALNEQGMICDFGVIKKVIRDWMDRVVDHVLIVPTDLENLRVEHLSGQTEITWQYPDGQRFYCKSPQEAITLVDTSEITADNLAAWCHDQLLTLFPEEVKGLQVSFVPEEKAGAFYHYSHGLQQHDGNCQRIAHGHRSSIEVYVNSERSHDLEVEWAERWKDIYIGTDSHRIASENDAVNLYRYDAPQGRFELSLPASRCYDISTESTVEQIAIHLANQIKQGRPADEIEVRAFEGIGKGAIALA